jgi:hypothetical protein
MKRNNKLKQFHPDKKDLPENLPKTIEFWEFSNDFVTTPLKFVRIQGPFREMYQWDWFDFDNRIIDDENALEALRDKELEKE